MKTPTSRLLVASLLATCVTLLGTGCSEPPVPAAPPSAAGAIASTDTTVTTAVRAALASDPAIAALNLTVDTVQGEVQLSGFATDQTQIDRAIAIARGIIGVKNIDSRLTLRGTGGKPDGNADDSAITSAVKTALSADSYVKNYTIAVVTTKGDVRLTGVLKDQSQIDHAINLVRSIEGVHSIHDKLTVGK